MQRQRAGEAGYTVIELVVTIVLIAVVSVSMFGLFVTLVNSTVVAKRRSTALTLATNQMEYLKSLPYDALAVAGGSIQSANPQPATLTKTVNNYVYTITNSVSYADDAFDGCGPYPTQALKQTYCRNYPPPSGAPATDTNPADYKIIHVAVLDRNGKQLTAVDTQVSARVAETASTTGALFINVLDSTGNPVSGATVAVTNSTVSPAVNVSDTTDGNGIAIFYGLTPDSGNDYVITASKAGYSTLSTIAPNGSLQPTYSNQKILSQQASYVALKISPQPANSLLIETTDTNGNALGGVKTYIKGGYKKYTLSSDTAYYYDTVSPSDNRPLTDSGGLTGFSGLPPGPYVFCGDDGSVSCSVGGTRYYLAAAVPYNGSNPLNPVAVPVTDSSGTAPTYIYNGTAYAQKVRLMLTTNPSFPRVFSVAPGDVSLSAGSLSNVTFTVTGQQLPCSASAGSCGTSVKLTQGVTTYTASCTGASTGKQLSCGVNLTGVTAGNLQITVSTGSGSLVLPTMPLGGFNVKS